MTEGFGTEANVSFNAEVLLALGEVREEIRQHRLAQIEARRQAQYAALKNYLPLSGNVTLTAGGAGFADLGSPGVGRVWTVRMWMAAINGSELAANSAANVGWYIGVNVPGATAGSAVQFTSQWRDSFAGVPAKTTFTSDIQQARFGEHVFVIVAGGTANANMQFNVIVIDEPMKVGTPVDVR